MQLAKRHLLPACTVLRALNSPRSEYTRAREEERREILQGRTRIRVHAYIHIGVQRAKPLENSHVKAPKPPTRARGFDNEIVPPFVYTDVYLYVHAESERDRASLVRSFSAALYIFPVREP